MVRMSASGKHGCSAKTRSRPAKWHRWALAVVLAGAAGGFGYAYLPHTTAAPVADRLGPLVPDASASAGLLGQGRGDSYSLPAPIVTSTAKAPTARRKPGPTHSPRPTAPPASSGVTLTDASGLGLYDGQSSPAGIETAAKWLGSPNTIKYAQDFIDATDWSHISNGQKFTGYGLNWLTAFGKEHGKEVGLPEWGLNSADTAAGGGDDTYFMTQMASWIKANATGPAIFWNYGNGTLPLDIPNYTDGGTQDATAVFKAAFSTGI